jgi:hypothetical protein
VDASLLRGASVLEFSSCSLASNAVDEGVPCLDAMLSFYDAHTVSHFTPFPSTDARSSGLDHQEPRAHAHGPSAFRCLLRGRSRIGESAARTEHRKATRTPATNRCPPEPPVELPRSRRSRPARHRRGKTCEVAAAWRIRDDPHRPVRYASAPGSSIRSDGPRHRLSSSCTRSSGLSGWVRGVADQLAADASSRSHPIC